MPVIAGEGHARYLEDIAGLWDYAADLNLSHLGVSPTVKALQRKWLPAGQAAEGVQRLLGDDYAKGIVRVLFDRTCPNDVDALKTAFCSAAAFPVRCPAAVCMYMSAKAYEHRRQVYAT